MSKVALPVGLSKRGDMTDAEVVADALRLASIVLEGPRRVVAKHLLQYLEDCMPEEGSFAIPVVVSRRETAFVDAQQLKEVVESYFVRLAEDLIADGMIKDEEDYRYNMTVAWFTILDLLDEHHLWPAWIENLGDGEAFSLYGNEFDEMTPQELSRKIGLPIDVLTWDEVKDRIR